MSLDDLVAKKNLIIDPKSSYKRKTFVEIADMLYGDLKQDFGRVSQNINDRDALDDLIGDILPYTSGEPGKLMTAWQENPHLAVNRAKELYTKAYDSMAEFVKNNRDTLLGELSDEQLNEVLMTSQLYVTGNKKYDKFRGLREKLSKIQAAKKEGKNSDILQKELQELLKKMSPDEREYTERNAHSVIPILMESIEEDMQKDLNKLYNELFTAGQKLNRSAIKDYLEKNYKAVEDKMDEAPRPNQKAKLWYDNLRPQYNRIAEVLLPTEKKDQKLEDDREKEEFKQECRKAGMRI